MMHGRCAESARMMYWTPNKYIYEFSYANEVALEECRKRNIDVMFGWEMIEVKRTEVGEKVAIFRNVDTHEVIEKSFFTAMINPPSNAHKMLTDVPNLCDASGGVDINKYTMQHKHYENIFAFGDCIGGQTTRTYTATMAQSPIVKQNVLNYLQGKDCNAIYDGYSYMPLYLGHSYCTAFSHLHDFAPAPRNHMVPHFGIFSRYYFGKQIGSSAKESEAYSDGKKNHGPPNFHYSANYDDLEHSEILAAKGVTPEEVRHPNALNRIENYVAPEIAAGH